MLATPIVLEISLTQVASEPSWVKQPLTLPTLVEYKAGEGDFSSQTFRSTLTGDEQNRLLRIIQKYSDPSDKPIPSCQFEYAQQGL